ncbi:MAG: hypothetical protein QM499_09565 [Flavobacteriaceae bacterium]
MPQSKKGNNGCLWFIVLGLLSTFSFIITKVVFSFSTNISLLLAIGGSVLFLKLILGKSSSKSIVRSGIAIYIILYGLKLALSFLLNDIQPNTEKISFNKEEETTKTELIKENDTTILYSSNRNWIDNYGNHFEGTLSVRENDYHRLKNNIDQFTTSNNKSFWGSLYNYLEQADTSSLDLIMETFIKINNEKKLNQMEFAEMVVSCIQDIPYSFVLQGECPTDHYEDSMKSILEGCPDCCIGNIKYGIQNPVSFIKNLKGDCDTRTVIIYSILKHFKYDVAIVNSDYYRHSIIGINLPSSGYFKVHNGKKYALWETTAMYYKAGDLPVSFNNVNYWDIVLTSK